MKKYLNFFSISTVCVQIWMWWITFHYMPEDPYPGMTGATFLGIIGPCVWGFMAGITEEVPKAIVTNLVVSLMAWIIFIVFSMV